jgi:F-type H+-transporting ATPase subunit delta
MSNKTAAIRYARALFDVAIAERADLARVEQELAGYHTLFENQPTLKKVLLNPAVPVQRKRAAIVQLSERAQTSPIVGRLMAMLAERDRLILLPDLLASYRERMLDHQNVVRAEVTTTAPLAAGQLQTIQSTLASVTGRTVTVHSSIDPAILGGMVARVGSVVYDASITRQLEKMKQRLTESM